MGWRDFDNLLRAENAAPRDLDAAIKANPNNTRDALRVAMFRIFNLKEQEGFEHLVNWVWKLAEFAARYADDTPQEIYNRLFVEYDGLAARLYSSDNPLTGLDLEWMHFLRGRMITLQQEIEEAA